MRRHVSKRPSRSLAESTSWFNNAGNFFAGFFEELRPEQVRNQIETLLFGPMNVTRAVLPVMRKQRSGLLIIISSAAGIALLKKPSSSSASASVRGPCNGTCRRDRRARDREHKRG